MKKFWLVLFLGIFAVTSAMAAVKFLTEEDVGAGGSQYTSGGDASKAKQCINNGYTVTKKSCSGGNKTTTGQCPHHSEYYQSCSCDKKFVYACKNTTEGELGGDSSTCDEKFSACKCAAGRYWNGSACVQCNPGSISSAGAKVCTPCPVGYAQNLYGQTSCVKCLAGTYQDETGQKSCKNCRAGTYQNAEGATSCVMCSMGFYQDTVGKTSCLLCKGGTTTNAEGSDAASDCSINCFNVLHATSWSQTEPCVVEACEEPYKLKDNYCGCNTLEYKYECSGDGYASGDGTVCNNGTVNLYKLCRCKAGYYWTGSACEACESNACAKSNGMTSCSVCGTGISTCNAATCVPATCAAGYYKDGTSCVICPAGYYCEGGKCEGGECEGGEKIACGVGTFTAGTGSTKASDCGSCPAGKYSESKGATSCLTCPVGHYCLGGSNKTPCNEGTYRNTTGASTATGDTGCTKCDAGTYAANKGSTGCLTCAAGTYAAATGSSACTNCSAGYYCPGGAVITACPAGKYNPSTNGADPSVCIDCPNGCTCATEASTTATTCAAGYYATGNATECSFCGQGYWCAQSEITDHGRKMTCTVKNKCPNNSTVFCNAQPCPIGMVQDQCYCNAGYDSSGDDCVQCAKGTYKSHESNASCTTVTAGYCAPALGLTSQTKCTGNGVATCDAQTCKALTCDAGYYLSGGNCIKCEAGYYCKNSTRNSCNNGLTYQNTTSAAGSSLVTACTCSSAYISTCAGDGYLTGSGDPCIVNSAKKYTKCICKKGYSWTGTACVACTSGSQCAYKEGLTSCQTCTSTAVKTCSATTCEAATCNANYYMSKGSCIACPTNSTATAGNTSTTCTCKPGYYATMKGDVVISCTACPAGFYKTSAGNATSCNMCGLGTTASSATSSSCSVCPNKSKVSAWSAVEPCKIIACTAPYRLLGNACSCNTSVYKYACNGTNDASGFGDECIVNGVAKYSKCVCKTGTAWSGSACQ